MFLAEYFDLIFRPVPFLIDLSAIHTLVPSTCFNSGTSSASIKRRYTSSSRSNVTIQERDAPVCRFKNGFDLTKSISKVITPGVFPDNDYIQRVSRMSRTVSGYASAFIQISA